MSVIFFCRDHPPQITSKISVHHTRDTTFKQWTETLVLFHRGLLRTMRSLLKTTPDSSIVRTLVPRLAFLVVNGAAIEIIDYEIFLSCIDFLFGTLGACLEMEGNDGEFASLKIIQAMKLIALGGCGRNRDGSLRILNNISKLFAEEKSFRMCTVAVRQTCLEVALVLLLNVVAERTSPLQRVPISSGKFFSEDDVHIRNSFLSLIKSLSNGNLYPSYVLRLLTMLYFYRTPRFVEIDGNPIWICLPSGHLVKDIENILFEMAEPNITTSGLSLQGAACAMSICNHGWIAEIFAKFPIFDDASILRVFFPQEIYLALGMSISVEVVATVEHFQWRSSGPVLNETQLIFLTLLQALVKDTRESKFCNDSISVIATTMILAVICPWSMVLTSNDANNLSIPEYNGTSQSIENCICGLLTNIDRDTVR